MAKKQKNEEVNTETPQPTVRELTNEEKELLQSAVKLVIAKKRRTAIMVTLVTLAKHVELLLPYNINMKTLIEHIKAEVAKNYKIITLHDRIGEDTLHVEAVLLFNTIEELIDEFKQQKVDSIIKLIDAGLDSVEVYKKQNQ
jgi:aryl carrier-like protein